MIDSSASNDVSRDAPFDIEEFSALLTRWNRTINLVGPGDVARLAERHIADSLALVPLIPPRSDRGIDLGSGAGFPGLILAAATGIMFDLLEADHRKAAFLREAARILRAPVTIHPIRIETAALPPAPLVTARALAPLPRLLALAAPLLAPNGTALLPKGPKAAEELTQAAREWHMRVETIAGRLAPGAVILRITELRRAPSG
ncbi:MAG: 16S rRNA (guanine(527)-N(7))-methyltransferase RsmG [Acetobacteraceae bacterium]